MALSESHAQTSETLLGPGLSLGTLGLRLWGLACPGGNGRCRILHQSYGMIIQASRNLHQNLVFEENLTSVLLKWRLNPGSWTENYGRSTAIRKPSSGALVLIIRCWAQGCEQRGMFCLQGRKNWTKCYSMVRKVLLVIQYFSFSVCLISLNMFSVFTVFHATCVAYFRTSFLFMSE